MKCVSIHAPARGATAPSLILPSNVSMFQSTLPRGERLPPRIHVDIPIRFNPRSRAGSDFTIQQMQIPQKFQSTLPRGERHPQGRWLLGEG